MIVLILAGSSGSAQELLLFQQGRAGYAGTEDTNIFINKPGNNAGGEIMLRSLRQCQRRRRE
jgi:hypothetical protein